MQNFINPSALERFPWREFPKTAPFPWHSFENFLTPEAFRILFRDFPRTGLFEKHHNLPRGDGQPPHNRYYLACEKSYYHDPDYTGEGIIDRTELSQTWQNFLRELESGPYRDFIRKITGMGDLEPHYSWHLGIRDSEVSPHLDSMKKKVIHLFYFNTSGDWDTSWGGKTVLMGQKKSGVRNPSFSDFREIEEIPFLDNRSLFIQNTPDAWHGARKLTCPPDHYRRLFSAVWIDRSRIPFYARLKQWIRRNIFRAASYPGELSGR